MKKKIFMASLASTMLITSFCGCSQNKDADLTAYCFDENAKSYYGLTLDEINQKTNNAYEKENAYEVSDDGDEITYYLDCKKNLFNGKVKLDKEYPVYMVLHFKNNVLNEVEYQISETEGCADVTTLENDVLEQLQNETYPRYTYEWDDLSGHTFESDDIKIFLGYPIVYEDGELESTYPVYIEFMRIED